MFERLKKLCAKASKNLYNIANCFATSRLCHVTQRASRHYVRSDFAYLVKILLLFSSAILLWEFTVLPIGSMLPVPICYIVYAWFWLFPFVILPIATIAYDSSNNKEEKKPIERKEKNPLRNFVGKET